MRIVVWNCRMGFGKKRDILYALKPDIAVIPECSQDAVNLCAGDGYSGCWWGNKKYKGLAVIAANSVKRAFLATSETETAFIGSHETRLESRLLDAMQ